MSLTEPLAVPLPAGSRIGAAYASIDLADAYAIDLPPGTARDPLVLAKFVFAHQPSWIAALLNVRDLIVAPLGLKTARSLATAGSSVGRIGIFKVVEATESEVIMGENDRHLDFRASAFYQPGQPPRLVLSTVVHCHNLLGRSYLRLIEPFHRLVVKAYLRQAALLGWPVDSKSMAG